VDLGASSARVALGMWDGGSFSHHTVERLAHAPVGRCWDWEALLALCRRAHALALAEGATLGIDSWGVDVGLVLEGGEVLPPVCYRDESHARAQAGLARFREAAFCLTGIADQPFNTVFQLAARRAEDATLPARARWLLLPDLLAWSLGAPWNYEATIASTTQLVGLDGTWCHKAFEACGWPVPAEEPRLGGVDEAGGVAVVRVAGHDTASAVRALSAVEPGAAFVNSGTWTLVGSVTDAPATSDEARALGWTNERNWDGRVRLLKNVPGFYIANRVHAELFPDLPFAEWLDGAGDGPEFDCHDPRLFNPEAMHEAVAESAGRRPASAPEWAGAVVQSHAAAVGRALEEMAMVCGRAGHAVVLGGGGVRSTRFVEALRSRLQGRLLSGPPDATLEGNLAAQFAAAREAA
jgi:rhamnulokinase